MVDAQIADLFSELVCEIDDCSLANNELVGADLLFALDLESVWKSERTSVGRRAESNGKLQRLLIKFIVKFNDLS